MTKLFNIVLNANRITIFISIGIGCIIFNYKVSKFNVERDGQTYAINNITNEQSIVQNFLEKQEVKNSTNHCFHLPKCVLLLINY